MNTSLDHRLSHQFFAAAKRHWVSGHLAIGASTHVIWLMLGVLIGINSWNQLNYAFILDADVVILLALLLPAWGVTMVISKLVNRERPYLETKQTPLVDPFIHTASFPSAHATIAFSLAALTIDIPTLLPYMLVAATLVALGRVATGVHFFSDVLVGGFIGYFVTQAAQTAFLLALLFSK